MDISDLRKKINSEIFKKINPELPIYDEKENRLCELSKLISGNRFLLHPLYRYVPVNGYVIDSLLHEKIYLATADKMNDDYEGFIKNHAEGYNAFVQKSKQFQKCTILKSFSECKNNLKMWETYAEHHTGMRITYHFDELSSYLLNHFYPVQYKNEFFSCKHPDELRNSEYFYLRKTKKWEYEREWRFVYLSDRERFISLENCITEVCFGARMDKDFRDSIMKAVQKIYSNRNIIFYQATMSRTTLQVQELK